MRQYRDPEKAYEGYCVACGKPVTACASSRRKNQKTISFSCPSCGAWSQTFISRLRKVEQ
jgi:predicted RNA-binding Zn-ribbon protein involved in translation (DUF1610 family)